LQWERIENARLWVVNPGGSLTRDSWFTPKDPKADAQGNIEGNDERFVFTDAAQSVAGRMQFGEAIGTITAAFFEEKETRGLGIGKGEKRAGKVREVPFDRGRLLAVTNIKYVDGSALRKAPQAPR